MSFVPPNTPANWPFLGKRTEESSSSAAASFPFQNILPTSLYQTTTTTAPPAVASDPLLQSLLDLFPDAEPGYLRHCLTFYQDNHVERIVEKIHSTNNGRYPKKVPGTDKTNTRRIKNESLFRLHEMYPDCDVGYLRGLVLKIDHDHVRNVAEELLRVSSSVEGGYPRRLRPGEIHHWEYIRSAEYIKGARHRLFNEFPLAWKSTVKAVMAEVNNDYVLSYRRLQTLETAGWWSRIFHFLRRKSYGGPEMECPELLADVERLLSERLEAQSEKDHEVARQLNEDQYVDLSEAITCGCCYGEFAFEDMCQCEEAHLFCVECVKRYVSEGLFGQGALRGKEVKCIAGEGCEGAFTTEVLQSVLPADLFQHYSESVVEEELRRARLKLAKCPFCVYCEVDDLGVAFRTLCIERLVFVSAHLVLGFALGVMTGQIGPMLKIASLFLGLTFPLIILGGIGAGGLLAGSTPRREWDALLRQLYRKHDVALFRCRNPQCSKTSCLSCGLEALPLHRCYEKQQDGLRLYVERAMAAVHLRTCPKCQVSFEKLDGCNKMTCRCGYIMCYICRRDIRSESYAHFCDHFRPVPGECCRKCRKCDLYKVEDEERAIREAAERAKSEFLKAHPELACVERAQLEKSIGPPMTPVDFPRLLRAANEAVLNRILNFFLL